MSASRDYQRRNTVNINFLKYIHETCSEPVCMVDSIKATKNDLGIEMNSGS